jgi:hypothetical protein
MRVDQWLGRVCEPWSRLGNAPVALDPKRDIPEMQVLIS